MSWNRLHKLTSRASHLLPSHLKCYKCSKITNVFAELARSIVVTSEEQCCDQEIRWRLDSRTRRWICSSKDPLKTKDADYKLRHSPCECKGFLWVLRLPPAVRTNLSTYWTWVQWVVVFEQRASPADHGGSNLRMKQVWKMGELNINGILHTAIIMYL